MVAISISSQDSHPWQELGLSHGAQRSLSETLCIVQRERCKLEQPFLSAQGLLLHAYALGNDNVLLSPID